MPLDKQKLRRTLIRARAQRALEDDDELERQASEMADQLRYATSGKKQIDAGRQSPGRRGKYKVTPAELLAAVRAMSARFPRLTFNDVCIKVARASGYKSAWPVKRAAKAIKWPDPRSRKK